MNEKVKSVLNSVLERFETGDKSQIPRSINNDLFHYASLLDDVKTRFCQAYTKAALSANAGKINFSLNVMDDKLSNDQIMPILISTFDFYHQIYQLILKK